MMRAVLAAVLALAGLLLLAGCGRPGGGEAVAIVNGSAITPEAFAARYGAYQTATPSRDNILLRKRILDNMINEVLIGEDIRRQGFDRDSLALEALDKMRTQALLVAAAKHLTVDTMRITEAELADEFRAYNTKIAARFVYGKSAEEARAIRRRLEGGATFEAVAKECFDDPGLAGNGGSLGYIGYGELEPAFEEVARTIPVGTLSDPVRLSMGYAIIRVDGRVTQPLASENDFENVKEKLARSIQERKAMKILTGATHALAANLAPRFHEDALGSVFRAWPAIGRASAGPGAVESQALPGIDRGATLADIGSGRWTVGDFLAKLRRTTPGQRNAVRSEDDLKDLVRALATREELLASARTEGLDRTPEYLSLVEAKTTEYLLKRWGLSVQDTVGRNGFPEAELREYFQRNRELYSIPPERNVAEILVRTEPEARAVAAEVAKGKDFSDLARRKSVRLWAARKGGELGFGTKSTFGILGEKFFAAPVGKVIGPERVDPYYGVFKILAEHPGRARTFEESRADVTKDMQFVRKQDVFKAKVAELRSKAAVQIFEDRLGAVVIK